MKYKIMSVLPLLGIAVSLTTPGNAIAQPVLPDTPQIAQNSLIGQCRAVNRRVSVYPDRSEVNPIVAINANTEVILQGEVRNGWIVVTVPSINQVGFVRAQYLKSCATTDNIADNNGVCRRIIYGGADGMVIRANPSINARQVGTLNFDERLTIDPSATFRDSLNRQWVQLLSPMDGWMSNGLPGSSNIGACP